MGQQVSLDLLSAAVRSLALNALVFACVCVRLLRIARWDYTQRTCCGSNFTSTSTEPSCSISAEEDDSEDGGNMEGVRWGEMALLAAAAAVGRSISHLQGVDQALRCGASLKYAKCDETEPDRDDCSG